MASSSSSSSPTKKIKLRSSDGEEFEVDEMVAMESQTISNMIEAGFPGNTLPLPTITSPILLKVIQYCEKHAAAKARAGGGDGGEFFVADDELEIWDAEFVKVDQAILFDLILAANFLDIKSLLDLTCQVVADLIKGKTPEEIRKTFNVKDNFTAEEEEEVRKENQWAFE